MKGGILSIPTQLITWHAYNFGDDPEPRSEFLWCLKATQPGDRQIVWEGSGGRGLIAVVDFGEPTRRLRSGRYERWATATPLVPPISRAQLLADPMLAARLTGAGASALQGGPIRLTQEQGQAILRVAGGLPRANVPQDKPRKQDLDDEWDWVGEHDLPPEKLLEIEIADKPRLWKQLGFPTRPALQTRLPSGRRPDLLAPGIVGDVKRRVRANDGPAQIERYIDELAECRPNEAPWRGLWSTQWRTSMRLPRRELARALYQSPCGGATKRRQVDSG